MDEHITASLGVCTVSPNYIFQDNNGVAIVSINPEGFFYKGELIEDAGKAYHLFVNFMQKAANGR